MGHGFDNRAFKLANQHERDIIQDIDSGRIVSDDLARRSSYGLYNAYVADFRDASGNLRLCAENVSCENSECIRECLYNASERLSGFDAADAYVLRSFCWNRF